MRSFKYIWEVPMTILLKEKTLQYFAVMDMPLNEGFDKAFDHWKFNFDQVHKINKAPFGISMHYFWFYKG